MEQTPPKTHKLSPAAIFFIIAVIAYLLSWVFRNGTPLSDIFRIVGLGALILALIWWFKGKKAARRPNKLIQ